MKYLPLKSTMNGLLFEFQVLRTRTAFLFGPIFVLVIVDEVVVDVEVVVVGVVVEVVFVIVVVVSADVVV